MTDQPNTIKGWMLDFSLERLGLIPARSAFRESLGPAAEGLILPAYPGEMGIEIRYFLGRVEPWLRAGWRILARRPEFYPAGSAVRDARLFAAEDELFRRYSADRLAFGPYVRHPSEGNFRVVRELVARRKAKRLQAEWRGLLSTRVFDSPVRPWTRWDDDLAVVSADYASHRLCRHGDVALPSYLPPGFESDRPEDSYPDHVGVQMRAVSFSDDPRNSHVADVLSDAHATAKHLSLPILVYGHPAGSVLPSGTVTTDSLGDAPLLARELGYLRTCKVMLAPNSGWADLMCWLRVPVLVEERGGLGIFDMMAPFQPRLLLRRRTLPVTAQVDALLAGETAFHRLGSSVVDTASVAEWIRGRTHRS